MIKDHAQEWNVDSDQIMLMGFSAGGHLSASYATFGREIMGDIYIKPVALILGYARLDMLECDYKEKLERPSGRILTKYKNLVLFGTEIHRRTKNGLRSFESYLWGNASCFYLAYAVRSAD